MSAESVAEFITGKIGYAVENARTRLMLVSPARRAIVDAEFRHAASHLSRYLLGTQNDVVETDVVEMFEAIR